MSDQNHKSKKHFHFLTAALVIAAVAYFVLVPSKKSTDKTAETPPVATMTEPAEDIPPQPEAQQKEVGKDDIVVETKTLHIPNGEEAKSEAPAAEEAKTEYAPAVAELMAPRTLGSDSAPIKVTEYSSLTCGHCASFAKDELPKIKEAYIDTGKVQFIFKEFPLNEPAVVASQILRCMPQDKFVNFQDLLFEQQESWAYVPDYQDKLTQYAKLAGMGEESVKSCIDNVELKKALITDMQSASEKFKIASTPTFVVNGGEKIIVGHQPFSFFQESFDKMLAGEGSAEETPKAAE